MGTPTLQARRRYIYHGLGVLAAFIALGIFLAPPANPLDKADALCRGLCHQMPERSFYLNGRQLPLCARCTGTYMGMFIGLASLGLILRRGKASRLPPVSFLAVLGGFYLLWAIDGLNSYLSLFPGLPHLYEPRNWLRLVTGTLNGLALSNILYPIFNFIVWADPPEISALQYPMDLLSMLIWAGVVVFFILIGPPFLLYPVAFLTAGTALLTLTLINTLLAVIVLRQEAQAVTILDLLLPLAIGLAAALLELTLLGLFRDFATEALTLPF